MAIFNRYQRLTEDPNGIDPPPYDDGPDQYIQRPNYGPLTDPNVGLTGGTGPAAQIPQQDPQPSMQQHAMDDAGKLPPVAGGPPMPPPGLQGAPMPGSGAMPAAPPPQGPPAPPPGLAGAPAPPPTMSELAESAARKYATMAPPAAPKNNILQTIGQTALGMSRLGPQAAAAIIHPKYTQQLGQFGQQKQDLAEQVKLADAAATVGSQETQREQTGDSRIENAITNAAKQNNIFLSAPLSPDEAKARGLLQIPNPMAGGKTPFANAVSYHDTNAGKFLVTLKQAELANGALDGQVGRWIPMSELPGLIKAGVESGKATKDTTVPVSEATARAHKIMTAVNSQGTVDVPISLALAWPETGKTEKADKVDDKEKFVQDYLRDNKLPDTSAGRARALKEYSTATQAPERPERPPQALMIGPDGKAFVVRPGVELPAGSMTASGVNTANAPTMQQRNVAGQAALVHEQIPAVIADIDRMKGKLGPMNGRWNEFMQGKIGTEDPDFASLRADLLMASSAVALMHARGRLPENLRAEFDHLINAPQQNPENLKAILRKVDEWTVKSMHPAGGGGQQQPSGSRPPLGSFEGKR